MSTSTDSPAPARDGEVGIVPDFFVVGHAKCGTTALYEMLRAHPQIFMPDLKEPAYFATDLRRRFQPPGAGPLPETLHDYLALFAPAREGQRLGEASSLYLWSHEAAAGIAALSPGAKIVAILREPASFLRSLHMQLLQNHIESEKDLRRAIDLEPERRAGRHIPRRSVRPQALFYSERVKYVEQMRRYHDVFDADQVLVLIYDDFRADNEQSVRRVLRFLDVDDTAPIEALHANPTVQMRSQQLDEIVNAVSVGRGRVGGTLKRAIKAVVPARARARAARLLLPLRECPISSRAFPSRSMAALGKSTDPACTAASETSGSTT